MYTQSYKVLLVEDNPGDVRLLEHFLKDASRDRFDLSAVGRLNEALARLEKEAFDIILLDLTLPDETGFDTFIKLQDHATPIPIIVVTATDDENIALKAVKMGAQDYLVKGEISNSVLTRSIRYGVERHRLWTELQQEYHRKLEQQERERRSLERMTGDSKTAVTAQTFGIMSVRQSLPATFEDFVQRYQQVMELVLAERAFKTNSRVSEELRALAEKLGFLKAGPRDVIEIHSVALKTMTENVPPQKAQAYVEEGRLLVLELMGYLTSFYRNYSLGIKAPSVEKPSQQNPTATQQQGNDQ